MTTVSVRDLRNHGGEVLTRVAAGEALVVTRDGVEIAELRPLRGPAVSAAQLIARRATLPAVDPIALRDDIDAAVDSAL